MSDLVAVYGSPRKKGNTASLLSRAVQGARSRGCEISEYRLRNMNIHPCLELYSCKKDGVCSIKDDFHIIRDDILQASGVLLASPIFFYAVTADTKMFMERFQSLWVKKYWIDKVPFLEDEISAGWTPKRKCLFISVGATQGKRLFDGALLSMKYFCDALDMELWNSLLYRGLDEAKDVLEHPEYLQEAEDKGRELAENLV